MSDKLAAVKKPEGHRDFTLDPRKLRRLRMEAALSVTELARRSGCSPAHITMLEKDRHGPSLDLVARLTDVLGCTPKDLMPSEPSESAA
jgi:transcriptional regulator with XRE-family HTH domain